MHIARVRLHRFRGYAERVIMPARHAVVVGEPRAGRSDLIMGLRRALDPRSWSRTPDLSDLYRHGQEQEEDAGDEETVVEVTLLGLGSDLEQDLDDRLELIDPATGLPAAEEQAAGGVLGVRVRYRIYFDEVLADYDHGWEYVATGAPVPRLERDMLAAVVIGPGTPLQLRSGGVFRSMVTEQDADAARAAITELSDDVTAAAGKIAGVKSVQEVLNRILDQGAACVLGMQTPNPAARVGFVADDGSVDALLRRLQPALALDEAGPLPLPAHGSTAKGVLAVAEAMTAANIAGAVVLADDFGDDLDAASGEFLAAVLRRAGGQVWLSTRRPEVVRAFDPTEVLRLTRSHGERRHHQLAATTDKKARLARRQLHLLLLPAMTTRSVALLEGPHDLEGYGAVAERRLADSGTLPPAAYGVRMIAAGIGGGGGKEQLPKLAGLARELGFHVRVVIDNDKPGSDAKLLADLDGLAEQVIRLPQRTAVERALARGLPADAQRAALSAITELYGLDLNVDDIQDADLEESIVKQLKQKNGLHQPLVAALPDGAVPPVAAAVLDTLTQPAGQQVLTELRNP
jgi:putative ATP-dependent endonuclease of the OLD family